jgi:hypothetical protein
MGGKMPRYLSLHTTACLTRQGAEQLLAQLAAAGPFTLVRAGVNMVEGKILCEFEAANREAVVGWMEQNRFHFDWVWRVEWEWADGKLQAAG